MNEHDAFESELAALKPQPPSLELKARIAWQLEYRAQPSANRELQAMRRIWQLSLALGLLLGVLGILASRRQKLHPVLPQPSSAALDLMTALDRSLPTLWTYHRAISASPQEIDAVLDQHSRTAPTPASEFHVSAFSMSPSELESF